MIRAICYYTNQEEDEPSSLRKQQHQCLEAVHDYGWVIHREVFDPFMKKVKIAQRSGMRTLLHEAAAHKFDLLVMMDKHFIGTCKEETAVILMATPHNTTPTKENILGAEQGQGCPLKMFAMTN